MSSESENTVIYRAYEPVEEVVVRFDRISAGLTSPLDYPVMLHALFLMEEWRLWRGQPRREGQPEPEFSAAVVLRRLEAAGVAWPDGRAVSVGEVDASLQRIAEAGAVRGLRPGGGVR